MTVVREMLVVTMAALASVAVACSSPSPSTTSPQGESTPTSLGSASSSSAASPTTIPGTITPGESPVVLHKQIGETAGVGCPDDPAQPCDVNLVITSIQSGVQCEDEYGDPLQADEQMVRFDIDVTTAQQFMYPDIATALFADNWGIGDASGVVPELKQHVSLDCRSDQIQKSLLPGVHMKKSIVVTAPKSATILRLYLNDDGSGWTWDVPPYAG